jgi:Recombination endonuclease VII
MAKPGPVPVLCQHGYADRNRSGKCRLCQRERTWVWKLRHVYGITPAEYFARLNAQNGCCAICGAAKSNDVGWQFHVDHDHATGTVRGLLCQACNVGLGHFDDRVDLLERAMRYLSGQSLQCWARAF